MIISPFNPIFFIDRQKRSGQESTFVQIFSTEDEIFLEVIRTNVESPCICELYDAVTGELKSNYSCQSYQINPVDYVDYYTIMVEDEGTFILRLGDYYSEAFMITEDSHLLHNTVLFRYSPYDNRQRKDVVPIIDGNRKYFSFRVPGGFKDEGWTFSVENEQFVTDMQDIIELYSMECTQKSLTIGLGQGVPIWYGQLINRLLTCRYVYIDGLRYARFEASVPEKEQVLQNVNSFVFTQKLQQIHYLEPTI